MQRSNFLWGLLNINKIPTGLTKYTLFILFNFIIISSCLHLLLYSDNFEPVAEEYGQSMMLPPPCSTCGFRHYVPKHFKSLYFTTCNGPETFMHPFPDLWIAGDSSTRSTDSSLNFVIWFSIWNSINCLTICRQEGASGNHVQWIQLGILLWALAS